MADVSLMWFGRLAGPSYENLFAFIFRFQGSSCYTTSINCNYKLMYVVSRTQIAFLTAVHQNRALWYTLSYDIKLNSPAYCNVWLSVSNYEMLTLMNFCHTN